MKTMISIVLVALVAALGGVTAQQGAQIDARYECSHVMNVPIQSVEQAYVLNGGCQVQCNGNNRHLTGSIREGLPCTDNRGFQQNCRQGQCGSPQLPTSTPYYPPVQQTGTLDLTIQKGKVPQMKAWYQKGKSNTYVNVYLGSTSHRIGASPVVRNTLDPVYNYRLTAANTPRDSNIILSLMESRKDSKDDFIGQVIINVNQVVQQNRNGVTQRYFIAHKEGNNKYYLDVNLRYF